LKGEIEGRLREGFYLNEYKKKKYLKRLLNFKKNIPQNIENECLKNLDKREINILDDQSIEE
jgi:hypothetical protein